MVHAQFADSHFHFMTKLPIVNLNLHANVMSKLTVANTIVVAVFHGGSPRSNVGNGLAILFI